MTFDPRNWPAYAQQVRRDDNPAMLPIALVGTLGFSVGLLSRVPYAHLALIIALSPLLIISLFGATLAMIDSLRNAFCFGFGGSRSWFELARAALIAGVLMSIATIVSLYFGISVMESTGIPIVFAFASFLVGSTMGYLLVGDRDDRPLGNDTVDFFLLQFLAGAAAVIPVILLGRFFDPMYIIGFTVIVALSLAAALKTLPWKEQV